MNIEHWSIWDNSNQLADKCFANIIMFRPRARAQKFQPNKIVPLYGDKE